LAPTELHHRLEHEAEVVGMHEVRAVSTADIAPTEDPRQRIAVPEDVELLVEEQGELTLLATHRVQGSLRVLHPSPSAQGPSDLSQFRSKNTTERSASRRARGCDEPQLTVPVTIAIERGRTVGVSGNH